MANRDSFDDFENDDQDDGFLTFDARDEEEDRSRGPLVIAAIVTVLLICGIILWQLYAGRGDSSDTPQITADSGAFKTAPADTGGAVTDDIDKGVYDAADGNAAPPLDVQPATGAEDPLLADGAAVPAQTPKAAPTTAPVPTPAPRRDVAAVAPKPAPAPNPASVAKPVVKAAPVKVAQAAPRPVPAPVPKVAVAAPVAKVPAPEPVPVAVAAATPTPKANPASGRSGSIGAQLGSFQTRASADTALAQYRASGLSGPVSVVAADLGAKGTWYRIRATGFDSRAEVEGFCSKARSAGAQCIPSGR
jgi:outer membrane biosynthesis protein TonB